MENDKIILWEALGNIEFPENFLHHFHIHIFCQRGSFQFVFNDKKYTCKAGEFVFWFADSNLKILAFSKNFKAGVLLVERNFLDDNLPDQNRSIDSLLHSKENPILYLSDKSDKQKVLFNFRLLHEKYLETQHHFYHEVLKLQMRIFVLEMWHIFANEYEHRKRTLQIGTLYEQFMFLVGEHCMTEREVQFYANEMHISAKHLNFVCKQNTGISASEWIQRHVKERVTLLLQDKNLNISEIADKMEFSSRSFFTRYVKKIMGITPSEFRSRMDLK